MHFRVPKFCPCIFQADNSYTCHHTNFKIEFKVIIQYRLNNNIFNVGFEVSTAMVMKSIIFWDMTPCSPLICNRRFGGTYRLHL
jgi:hypothetical protein